MTELILYKKHFNVFIKGIEEPMELSNENGEALRKVLGHLDCPPFVQINGGSYNRFEIARVVPYEELISPQRAEAIAENERLEKIIEQTK